MIEKSNTATTGMLFARVKNAPDFFTETVELSIDEGTPAALRLEADGINESQITFYFLDLSSLEEGDEILLGKEGQNVVSSWYRDSNHHFWEPRSGSIVFFKLDLETGEVVVSFDFKAFRPDGSLPDIEVYGGGSFKGLVTSAQALSVPD